ncbi:MAG: hypothetical protein RBQ99_06620 [Trichlorobacter sp.]|jgi:hypothetical protein|nr:hypothetical protein [Trichlorobacter sp.]
MQAQRIVTKADATGHLTGLPLMPPGRPVEVIMLLLDNQIPATRPRRKPPTRLQGKIRETGDVLSSASVDDWGVA